MIHCNNATPSIVLLRKLLLNDFPSGSSLEFYDNKLYLIGDDAKQILILDADYNYLDSVTLFEGARLRIPKYKKADLEASTTIDKDGEVKILVFGSAAVPNREVVFELSPGSAFHTIKTISTAVFINRLKQAGVTEINIEGAAVVKDALILCNRANETNTINQFIVTDQQFLYNQTESKISIIAILLPSKKSITGISGLAYVAEKDLLLFTASTELTGNAYDDGEIGDSYIGWIKNVSSKLRSTEMQPDGLVNLSEVSEEFAGEKIESICVEKFDDEAYSIHLVADNDRGDSRLFKVKFSMQQ